MLTLREHLERPGSFVIAAELVTSRGLLSGDSGRALQTKARELAANPRIDVLSITDNPGGHAMLAPDTLGSDLLSLGQEVIIHLSCKDWNRNALESRGWKLGSEGFRNVFFFFFWLFFLFHLLVQLVSCLNDLSSGRHCRSRKVYRSL